jgi:hypothetical protein
MGRLSQRNHHHCVLWVTLIAVLTSGLTGCESTAPRAPTSNQTFGDKIVPGVSLGPIALCITEGQLYSLMGSPSNTATIRGRRTYSYGSEPDGSGGGLIAWADKRDRISQVTMRSGKYATAEGVTIGASELEVRAKLGSPRRAETDNRDEEYSTYYYHGLVLLFHSGRIYRLYIWTDC